jgi:hypothetical protein
MRGVLKIPASWTERWDNISGWDFDAATKFGIRIFIPEARQRVMSNIRTSIAEIGIQHHLFLTRHKETQEKFACIGSYA